LKHFLRNTLSRTITVKDGAAGEAAGCQPVMNATAKVGLQVFTGSVGGFIEAESLGGVEGGGDATKTAACIAIRPQTGWQRR